MHKNAQNNIMLKAKYFNILETIFNSVKVPPTDDDLEKKRSYFYLQVQQLVKLNSINCKT